MRKEELIEALQEALNSKRVIDNDTHKIHHQFIEMMIKKEERSVERWEKIKTQVWGWGIVAVLSAIGTAVYKTFFHS